MVKQLRISKGRLKRDAKLRIVAVAAPVLHKDHIPFTDTEIDALRKAWVETHIYDWIELHAQNDGEVIAKAWFDKFTVPATEKDREWIAAHKLFCTYEGIRWRVTGASRLGDVWLTLDFERNCGYEKRVDVTGCSSMFDYDRKKLDRLISEAEKL